MQNQKLKVVYSLRIHIELQKRGFTHITEMKNPQNQHLNCWVYAATPDFIAALDALLGEVSARG